MKRLTLWFALAALFAGCGGKTSTPAQAAAGPGADLALICAEAEAAADRDAFAAAVTAKLTTDEGRNIFAAAGQAADDQKNAVIQRGAAEVGVTGWDCAGPLEKLYGAQTRAAAAP
jgi:hypothetical protein